MPHPASFSFNQQDCFTRRKVKSRQASRRLRSIILAELLLWVANPAHQSLALHFLSPAPRHAPSLSRTRVQAARLLSLSLSLSFSELGKKTHYSQSPWTWFLHCRDSFPVVYRGRIYSLVRGVSRTRKEFTTQHNVYYCYRIFSGDNPPNSGI